MANADDPKVTDANPETAIQSDAPAESATPPADVKSEDERITLAPIPGESKPPTSFEEHPDSRGRIFSLLLIGALCVLAFEMASFQIANADHLRHLATGRAILKGEAGFGEAHNLALAEGTYWTNSSWLYDVISYLLYSVIGHTGLLLVKALAIAFLAWLMFRVSRARRSQQVALIMTLICVLAMGPRLLLQPIYISMLFLGLTLYFLHRGSQRLYPEPTEEEATPVTLKSYWPLLVLFILWSNMDEWFILGPLTVFLYFLGRVIHQAIDSAEKPREGEVRTLGMLVGLSLVVCLINPHHIHAFRLPTILGFSSGAEALKEDGRFQNLFRSPFSSGYFSQYGASIVGISYFLLILLGLISFGASTKNLSWSGALLWLVFLALSVYRDRLIPFFAIISAPVIAWNFQQAFIPKEKEDEEPDADAIRLANGARMITLLIFVSLIIAAYPGWLHTKPYARRRVNPQLSIDPSLVQSTQRIQQLEDKGIIRKNGRWLNIAPESGAAMAWFCPNQKVLFDYRFEAIPKGLKEAKNANKLLVSGLQIRGEGPIWRPTPKNEAALHEWLKTHQIDSFLFYDQVNGLNQANRLLHFLPEKDKWAVVYLDGRSIVVTKVTPENRTAVDKERVSLKRLALLPEPEERPGPYTEDQKPGAGSVWTEFFRSPQGGGKEVRAADFYAQLFLKQRSEDQARLAVAWNQSRATKFLARMTPCAPVVSHFLPAKMLVHELGVNPSRPPQSAFDEIAVTRFQTFFAPRLKSHYYLALLAVRQARIAIQKNPSLAEAHYRLGVAYGLLRSRSRERTWERGFPELGRMRFVQEVNAYHHAIKLDPNEFRAHIQLAEVYGRRGYLDLRLKHLEEATKIYRRLGPRNQSQRKNFSKALADLEAEVKRLRPQLATLRNQFKKASKQMIRTLPKARQALSSRLAEEALKILESQDLSAFGTEGALLELQLYLDLGMIYKQVWVEDLGKFKQQIGPGSFNQLWSLRAAAMGDYDKVDEHLLELQKLRSSKSARVARSLASQELVTFQKNPPELTISEGTALAVGSVLLDGLTENHTPFNKLFLWRVRQGRLQNFLRSAQLEWVMPELQLRASRAILMMEQGRHEEAEKLFRSIRERHRQLGLIDFADLIARDYLRLIKEAKEE